MQFQFTHLCSTCSIKNCSGQRGISRGDALTTDLNRPIGLAFSNDGRSLFVSGCTDLVPQHTQASTPAKIWEVKLVE
ncbi:MAG: hypothetical protein AAGI23_08400 [Bacteroidota bacterium]